jgi:hypothetical protein
MPTRKNFDGARKRRQEAAAQRQAESDRLTPAQRLERLDAVFGQGRGATKERIKLHQRNQT